MHTNKKEGGVGIDGFGFPGLMNVECGTEVSNLDVKVFYFLFLEAAAVRG